MTCGHMARWEYLILDLANLQAETDEIDQLDEAGEDGWELISITSANVAYLRRPLHDPAHVPKQLPSVRRRKTGHFAPSK